MTPDGVTPAPVPVPAESPPPGAQAPPLEDTTRWDTPHFGVRAVKVYLVYFAKTYGRERLEQVWRYTGMPLPLSYVEDLSNYVSVPFVERLLETLTRASGDPRFLDRAARFVATPEALGFGYYLLRGTGTPKLAYRKLLEVSPTFNRIGQFTVESLTDSELQLSYLPRIAERDKSLCITRMANFASFPTIWGVPEATVVELACMHRGDATCRYRFTWRNPPPLAWRRLAGAGLGLGAGVLAHVLGTALTAHELGEVVAMGFLAGAWLDLRAVSRQKDVLLAEQTRGMTRSVQELEKRADDIYRANVELDKRVADRTRDLEEALEKLRQLDRLKSEFFANVSHELRTPLTLISAPIEARLAEALPAVERDLLEGLRRNAHRLLRLIDDLLDLSRIDAGHLRLDVVPVDLSALARQLETLYSGGARARGVRLMVDAPEHTHEVFGDLHRLDSIVSNLLGNALKFTPRGGVITLSVREAENEVYLTVTDSGPGIAAVELPRIFERYYQVNAPGRPSGGVGIGLSLAKNLAELHGGRLEVRSEPEKGSTFLLSLPRGRSHLSDRVVERRRVQRETPELRRATDGPLPARYPSPLPAVAPAPPPRIDLEHGRRARLLVVEDNDELREMLRDILSGSAEVLLASDGAEGLAVAERERPDLVLTDVMMPGMSGTELCAAVKSSPTLRSTPVLLLTARSGAEAALDGYAAGADEFVEKPFHPRVLVARVAAQLRLRSMTLRMATQARLAAVGSLAAGVGHEVRNPVNAVLNGVRVLQHRHAFSDENRILLDVIAEGANRIERISGALLDHARPGDQGGARPVDVTEGLESTLQLLGHRLDGVTVSKAFAATGPVVASSAELNQVFLNLLDNGIRAPATHLWLSVAEEAGMVRVLVEDDGPGIPASLAARIFDAFFTTREPGQGTGLGLYLSRDIVERWGGTLSYAPRAGGGASFLVELPREAM